AGEARREQDVLLRVDREIVAVAVAAAAGRHRVGGDELALVVVERNAGDAALVFGVRERLHQHPPGERVVVCGPRYAVLSARSVIVWTSLGFAGSVAMSKT